MYNIKYNSRFGSYKITDHDMWQWSDSASFTFKLKTFMYWYTLMVGAWQYIGIWAPMCRQIVYHDNKQK